jgi:hypothetical protein
VNGWGGEDCGKEERSWPICGQVYVRNVLLDKKLNREDYGVDKSGVLLAVVKE